MTTKIQLLSMAAGFALILPAQAGSHYSGGGMGGGASASSGSSSSHSAPSRSFSGRNFSGRNFAAGNFAGRNFAGRSGSSAGPRMVNGRLNSGGAHIVARQAANAHPNWSRNHDHFWHGHRCRFVNGSWFLFDFGYDPFFWGYPYGYPYAYGYPYGYPYGAYEGYDQSDDNGVYQGRDPGYQGSDRRDSGYQGSDNGSYSGSPVALAQSRLKRLGYYHGQIDGQLGPATQRAITEYQRDHGQRVTGSVNRNTLNSIQGRD